MTDRTPQPSPAVPGLDDTCRKVQWRLRFQRAVQLMTPTGAAALGSAGVAILLGRLRWLDTGDETLWLCGVGIALTLAGLLGVTRRVTALEAAQRLDQAGGLYDRLGSALAFSRLKQRTPMQAAAIADARRFVADTSPSAAAPWRRPAGLRWLTVGLALTVAGLVTHVPVPPLRAAGLVALEPVAIPERPKPALTPEERAELIDEQARLEDETRRSTDPRVSAWINELNELLRALHAGRVTPTQAHAAIARLEQARAALAKTLGDDAEALAAHAQKAAKKTKTRAKRPVAPTLQALRAQRWQEAAEALERLAGRVETGDLSKRERKRVGRDLAKLADRLKTERQKTRERLHKERDRLKKKQAKDKDRFSKRDRNRLKKTKRQLERLERQREQAGEMRRQLERLQRGLDKGAAELMR
ncbi:MAG: hypothetical protein QF464_02330, partial [Myxococcota bacterium]|nr:hypothetical protein [Myxococcota bacterium]